MTTKLNPGTNRIIVSGASGTGKSLLIDPVVRKLLAHGYTLDTPRIVIVHPDKDWLEKIYQNPEVKRCKDRFCIVETVVAKAPLAVHFEDYFGGLDFLSALEGNADPANLGLERVSRS